MKIKLCLFSLLFSSPWIASYAQVPFDCDSLISCTISADQSVVCRSTWKVTQVRVHGNPATGNIHALFSNAQSNVGTFSQIPFAHCNYTTHSSNGDQKTNYINVQTSAENYVPDHSNWKSKWEHQGNSWTCNGNNFDSLSDTLVNSFNCGFFKNAK